MSEVPIDNRATWPFEPLYKFLFGALPRWRSATGILDVPKIAEEMGISTQAVYKWLHRGALPGKRARQLHEMANRQSNAEQIDRDAVESIDLTAFYAFVD